MHIIIIIIFTTLFKFMLIFIVTTIFKYLMIIIIAITIQIQ